jgi:hypothetical protein
VKTFSARPSGTISDHYQRMRRRSRCAVEQTRRLSLRTLNASAGIGRASYVASAARLMAGVVRTAQHRSMTKPRVPLRRPGWPGGLVMLLLFGLLGLFHQVVRSAVQQGQLRREATALHSAALWRCKAMPQRRLRDACLQRLDATLDDVAALRANNALTIAALERLHR